MSVITLILSFITSPIGRWIAGSIGILVIAGSIYMKGRWDQRTQDKTKLQAEISRSVQTGNQGKADALKQFDQGHMPDSWFRD